jgi:hypothetical protein
MANFDSRTAQKINALLSEMAALFKSDCECTFIMRRPGDPECELVASNDDLNEVILVLQRSKKRRG